MKNILSRFGKISLLLAFMYFVVGCDDDKEDVAPGLYVMSDEIETFPVTPFWYQEPHLIM